MWDFSSPLEKRLAVLGIGFWFVCILIPLEFDPHGIALHHQIIPKLIDSAEHSNRSKCIQPAHYNLIAIL